ncbi:hypothetical protein BRYFOR_09276 [Marvinbryantia formatexigens DSM 14469]|uniref:Uncharacterized protein n=1 Tax=Marvinbryantia formatexigens DSM 14469 TaxID=478749 RepID=C6LKS9_9FIRM|nr:hypothetical protein BRYFOR_09276 [Marvinbryantia formatexigens DSM 14469]
MHGLPGPVSAADAVRCSEISDFLTKGMRPMKPLLRTSDCMQACTDFRITGFALLIAVIILRYCEKSKCFLWIGGFCVMLRWKGEI